MRKTALLLLLLFSVLSLAFSTTATIDSDDTAWVLVSTALVMMMTPAGLAIFYGGMARSKNILNSMGMSVGTYAIVSVLWVIYVFSLSFGGDVSGVIGNLKYLFMHVNMHTPVPGTHVSILAFSVFQLTFAAITTALISGSVIERVKSHPGLYSAYCG